ncbi:divalent-cation tolerance protein CutA [Nocardia takedensis]|uniref:divalent-cation tolerance protein CutA n=1 Tax=Nocardia takedensis TaxID=259390 RepID=UPI003F775472
MTVSDVWSVTSTAPTEDDARSIAKAVVAERLAASADVSGPAISVFWHLGELGEGKEWRMTFRTSLRARDRLAARIADLHPWDNPEITATAVEWCTEDYRNWLERSTDASAQPGER